MISEKDNKHISKFLSLVLRHQPETIGLSLDENGWADVDTLLAGMNEKGLRIDRAVLEFVVASNAKQRFTFDETGNKIRANQGHSIEVDLNLQPVEPPEILYHGTSEKSVASILQSGLEKRERQQVHLSADAETAIKVGSRHGKPVVLEVLAGEMHRNGHRFFLSKNGVWLTGHVPVNFLKSR